MPLALRPTQPPAAQPPTASSIASGSGAPSGQGAGTVDVQFAPVGAATQDLLAPDVTRDVPVTLDPLDPPRPNEQDLPIGLDRFQYGSGDVPLVDLPPEAIHLNGGIGTPPEVAELAKYGAANVFSPEWQAFLEYAVQANGGLGDAETGYLAFSREFGFVRFKHPGFTPEQNRRIAAISLQTGWPLERLPGRHMESNSFTDPDTNRWVDEFIGKFDEQMAGFLEDPSNSLYVKDGSRNRYELEYNSEFNRVVSTHWRKKGGFAGFAADNLDIAAPILDGLSIVATIAGQPYLAVGLQTAKEGLTVAATGDFDLSQGIGIAASWLSGPLASTRLGQALASPVGRAGLALGADLADDGDIDAETLVGVVAPELLHGLPGGPAVDLAAQRAAGLVAAKIDGKDVGLLDILNTLEPVLVGVRQGDDWATTRDKLDQAGVAAGGTTDASWHGLLALLSDDPEDIRIMSEGLRVLAKSIDAGRFSAKDALKFLREVFKSEIDAIKASVLEGLGLDALEPNPKN